MHSVNVFFDLATAAEHFIKGTKFILSSKSKIVLKIALT